MLYPIEHTGKPFDEASIAVVSLRTGEHKVVLRGGTAARYYPSGHLVYARRNRLLAVPFDLRRLEVKGEATTVAEGVASSVGRGCVHYAISRAGSLALVPGLFNEYARDLAWITRDGRQTAASAERRGYSDVVLAPDGVRAPVHVQGSDDDLWSIDLERDVPTRITFGHENSAPVWAADGRRFAWVSDRDGTFNLYMGSLDTGAGMERLTTSENARAQAFPGPGPRRQVSDQRGADSVGSWRLRRSLSMPRWSTEGRELFYWNGSRLMSVSISPGPELKAGAPSFVLERDGVVGFDIAPDGRFLIARESTAAPLTRVVVALGGAARIGRKAP